MKTGFIPDTIHFFTRDTQTPLHCSMARKLGEIYPEARIVFSSFYSQSVHFAQQDGFEAVYLPDLIRAARNEQVPESRIQEIDNFCQSEGMGLRAMVNTERFLPKNREKSEVFIHSHIAVLDRLIGPNTLGVSTMYDHFVYLLAGMLVHMKGGAHFAFVGCGVPAQRVVGLRLPWQTWVNNCSNEDTKALLEKARDEVLLPPEKRICYMRKREKWEPLPLKQRWQLAKIRKEFAKRDFEAGAYFPSDQRNRLRHALRWRWQHFNEKVKPCEWDITSVEQVDQLSRPFVFLALHMEPEATVLMYSPRLRDQLECCRLVAESLPADHLLLVKENPKMVGKRSDRFYKYIRSLWKVRLVSTEVPSPQLIERCSAVVSLGGTVTVEAALRGKPTFCFGRPPFFSFATVLGNDVLDHLQVMGEAGWTERNVLTETELEKAWDHWLHSTFPARSGTRVFNPRIGKMSYDDSEENTNAFCGFITDITSALPAGV